MKIKRGVIGCVLVAVVSLVEPANADGPLPGSSEYCAVHSNEPVCVQAKDDVFNVGDASSPPPAPTGGSTGAVGVVAPSTEVISSYAPACSGNTRLDVDLICGAALNTCLPADTGLVSYWRWQETVFVATGLPVPGGGWVQLPGTVCLGPDKVGVPSIAAITGVISRDFKKLVVLKGAADVRPSGTTLVNYATEFSTTAGRYVLAPVTVLGRRVVITAVPQQYDWFFGDGAGTPDGGAGPVTHTYSTTGAMGPYVVITWTGTFTVDGGPARDVFGTAQTTGDATPLQVKEARAELVTR
jgi:hypothetical protein